jgi:hypothetical protein
MKSILLKLFIAIFLLTSITITAQSKIKGNKNVTSSTRELDSFSEIEIDNNINVYLSNGNTQELEIEADDNIHEVISTDVRNGVLSVSLNAKIKSSKKLNIYITTSEDINKITTNGRSNLFAETRLKFDSLILNTNGKSKVEMNLKSNYLQINGSDNSDLKMTISCDSIFDVRLQNSSKLKANATTKTFTYTGSNNSVMIVEGKAFSIVTNTIDDSTFEGHSFISEEVTLTSQGTSDVYINAKDSLNISAKDKSEIYIFGKPTIHIEQLANKAILRKKEKMSLIRI